MSSKSKGEKMKNKKSVFVGKYCFIIFFSEAFAIKQRADIHVDLGLGTMTVTPVNWLDVQGPSMC